MIIANPIYDSVFKLLMNDAEVASGNISALIGMEVVELRVQPQEYVHKNSTTGNLNGLRLDFHATIRTQDGRNFDVIIEIQKAKIGSSGLRFRSYLGDRYRSVSEILTETTSNLNRKVETLPIISIYLLGYLLDKSLPTAIHVARQYRDAITQEPVSSELQCCQAFIERLSHDAYFIQIPKIKGTMNTELERVLSVFDQHRKLETDQHRLAIDSDQEHTDPLLKKIYRILNKAQETPEIEQAMTQEDIFLLEQQDEANRQRELRIEAEARLEKERSERKEAQRKQEQEQRLRKEAERKREEAEAELVRLRKRLEDK